ncbi:NAD(P)H dehydrogenase (quinone) [Agrobacterium tumefaciens]|nr:NAD(P)H dehydrogenase (quinone) [Agrobacterium radiobacter]MBB4454406.1 NAD(P)H dehydrogenase (quinone) [Agrobacterium radiobacter]
MTKPKVLIAFYSRNGSTDILANAIAEGAVQQGAEVRLRRARELVGEDVISQVPGWRESALAMNEKYEAPTEANAEWADAIVFGTPTRFGSISSELKAYIDGLGGIWFQGKLNGKVGSVFGSTSSKHDGNESTLLSIYTPMAHLGLIIVPLGYADPAMFKAGKLLDKPDVLEQRRPSAPCSLDVEIVRHRRACDRGQFLVCHGSCLAVLFHANRPAAAEAG